MLLKSKYIRLVRPIAWVVFLFPFSVGLGLGITPTTSSYSVIFCFFSFSFLMSFGFSVNAVGDVKVDSQHNGRSKDMNLAKQPLVTGELNYKKTIHLSIIFFVLSIFFSIFINFNFFVLILLLNIIGFFYSLPPTRLKEKPIGDIICNALLGMFLFAAGLNVGEINIHFLFFIGVFLMAANFYIPTVITDYDFDKKAGLNTSAVFFGNENLIKIMYFLTSGIILIMIFLYFISSIELKILTILIIIYTIIFTLVTRMKYNGHRLYIHENWILVPFGLISIIFIFYGILKLFGIFIINI
jgi:4-hydroxybenzoate polyprenyltransferase